MTLLCVPRSHFRVPPSHLRLRHGGRGIASRALGLLLAQVPLRPLHATAAATNTASIRVLMKHGFVIAQTRTSPETERCLARDEVSLVLANQPLERTGPVV